MNNSNLAIDEVNLSLDESKDITPKLIEREGHLVKIVEAINGIRESAEWSTLKTVFDSRVESLEKNLHREAESPTLNDSEIYRLQGRLFEARKYNFDKLVEDYREEILKIRKLIPPTER